MSFKNGMLYYFFVDNKFAINEISIRPFLRLNVIKKHSSIRWTVVNLLNTCICRTLDD